MISTTWLSTHWTAHIKMYYFQQVTFLFHLTENEAFQSSCSCGMICMSQVIQNQVSPNDPSVWSFFMHIYQYDSNCSATSMWCYHYYLIPFGMNMCITTIGIVLFK